MPINQLTVIDPSVSLSSADWTLGHLCRFLAERYRVSVVVADGLETKTVVADFDQVPVSQVFELLAKRVGVQVSRIGTVYYLGDPGPNDRGYMVRRVRRIDRESIQEIVQTMLSDSGRSSVTDDGLLVVSDQVTVLDRIHKMLDDVERTALPGWCVQMHVIGFSETAIDDFGVDTTPAGKLAATVALASSGGNALDVSLDSQFDQILRAVHSRADVVTVAEPMLLVADGREAKFDRVSRVPFFQNETRTSSNGVVADQRTVEFLDVGFTATVGVRELTADSALVNLNLSNSSITEIGQDLPPQTDVESFTSFVSAQSGGVYLAGHFESNEQTRRQGLGRFYGSSDESRRVVYQVWLRAYAIGGLVEEPRTADQVDERIARLPDIETTWK